MNAVNSVNDDAFHLWRAAESRGVPQENAVLISVFDEIRRKNRPEVAQAHISVLHTYRDAELDACDGSTGGTNPGRFRQFAEGNYVVSFNVPRRYSQPVFSQLEQQEGT